MANYLTFDQLLAEDDKKKKGTKPSQVAKEAVKTSSFDQLLKNNSFDGYKPTQDRVAKPPAPQVEQPKPAPQPSFLDKVKSGLSSFAESVGLKKKEINLPDTSKIPSNIQVDQAVQPTTVSRSSAKIISGGDNGNIFDNILNQIDPKITEAVGGSAKTVLQNYLRTDPGFVGNIARGVEGVKISNELIKKTEFGQQIATPEGRQVARQQATAEIDAVKRPIKADYKEPGLFGQMLEEFKLSTASLIGSVFGAEELTGTMTNNLLATAAGMKIRKEADKVIAANPEWQAPADQQWGKDKVGRLVAGAAPSLLGAIAAGVVTGPVGLFLFGAAGEGGSTYGEAIDAGTPEGKAQLYGMVVGAVNGTLEMIFPDGLLNKPLQAARKTITKEVASDLFAKVLKSGAKFTANGLKEGVPEVLQQLVSNSIAINYDKNRKPWDGLLESFVGGALSGGLAGHLEGKVFYPNQVREMRTEIIDKVPGVKEEIELQKAEGVDEEEAISIAIDKASVENPELVKSIVAKVVEKTTEKLPEVQLQVNEPIESTGTPDKKDQEPPTGGASVEVATQELRNYYAQADQEAVGQAHYEVFSELDASQAGTRTINESQVDGQGNALIATGTPSTFPDWIPDGFRTRKQIDEVLSGIRDLNNIEYPPSSQPKRQEFYDAILSEIDARAGVDSSSIRQKVIAAHEKAKLERTNGGSTQRSRRTEEKAKVPEQPKTTAKEVKKEEFATLPKEENVYNEAKKTGAKRIAPDRVAHQQLTPSAGIEGLVEQAKKKADNNANSWKKAAGELTEMIKKYGVMMPMRLESNLKKYPDLAEDFRRFSELRKNAPGAGTIERLRDRFLANADRVGWNSEKEKAFRVKVDEQYKSLVKDDISKGYRYPEEVLKYDKSFTTAVNNRERYEKGLRTSFSSDDERINFDYVDTLGAGMKRQDGKTITEEQKQEILQGVVDFSNTLGIDIKKLAEDNRWVYVHLNNKNPFLMKAAAGLYREGKDNVSVSVGGVETVERTENGKQVKVKINPTMAHELGHALDFKVGQKLFGSSIIFKRRYDYNTIEFSFRGPKYWSSAKEVTARMIEQYVSVEQGSKRKFTEQGYWPEAIYTAEIKPAVEAAIKQYYSEYKLEKPIEVKKVTPKVTPTVENSVEKSKNTEAKIEEYTSKRKVVKFREITDVDPLLEEARKYKSAEEFIKARTKPHYINIKDIKSSFDADTFSTLNGTPRNQNINLLNEYTSKIKKIEKSPVGREITKPISVEFNVGGGYRILDGNHRYLQALKNGDKRILVKFDTLKGTSQEGKNIFQEKTKSQLNDIWNQANSKNTKTVENSVEKSKNTEAKIEEYINKRKVVKFREDTQTENLTIKTIDRLEGRESVNKQFILDLTNSPDLKQAEKDLVRELLATFPENKVNVKDFIDKLKTELLPLDKIDLNDSDDLMNGEAYLKYENITLPDNLRGPVKNYTENLYTSPIKTRAGGVHFSGMVDNYFAHTRIEEISNNVKRVIELQSDLFQKGRLEKEKQLDKGSLSVQDIKNFGNKAEVAEWDNLSKKNMDNGLSQAEKKRWGELEQTLYDKAQQIRSKELTKLEPYRNNWYERIIREEVKDASRQGIKKLQFPTGETAMKIERLAGDQSSWRTKGNGRILKIEDLAANAEINRNGQSDWVITKVIGDGRFEAINKIRLREVANIGVPNEKVIDYARINLQGYIEEFDISNKVNTDSAIYKFYEKEIQRYLTRKYDAKQITDKQSVTWVEVELKPEYATRPIEAFRVKDDVKQFTGKTITDAQEKQLIDLNKQIFGDDNVKITLQIMANRKALGSSKDGMITIVDGQANPKDTFYHEAVHKYIDVFTTKEEQIDLFKAGIEKYGTEDLSQVEEKIAEDFITYAKNREGVVGKIIKLFDKILSRIKLYLGNENKIESLYQEILKPATQKKAENKPTEEIVQARETSKDGSTKAEREDAAKAPVQETNSKPKLSRVAERVLDKLVGVKESDISYQPMNIVQDAARASEFVVQQPEAALRIAKGLEAPPADITETAISIAMAEQAREKGDWQLYTRLILSRTFRQTRRGQEIVAEKGRMDENSSEFFIRKLLDERARIVTQGKKWLFAKEAKLQAVIKREVTELKKTIDKKVIRKLESAQKLIDSITCKI
jgi:hypothetical protein